MEPYGTPLKTHLGWLTCPLMQIIICLSLIKDAIQWSKSPSASMPIAISLASTISWQTTSKALLKSNKMNQSIQRRIQWIKLTFSISHVLLIALKLASEWKTALEFTKRRSKPHRTTLPATCLTKKNSTPRVWCAANANIFIVCVAPIMPTCDIKNVNKVRTVLKLHLCFLFNYIGMFFK